MTHPALDRWNRIAGRFTETVDATDPDQWSRPTPCEGWVARDVIVHLVEWVPGFLASGMEVTIGAGPDPSLDPVGAWRHLEPQVRALLEAPGAAEAWFDHPMAGRLPVPDAIDRFILGDVIIHTWDLARATGQDETLDPEMVSMMLEGMEPMADMLEASGHFGPRLDVAPEASEQVRLLALLGRRS